MRRLREVLDRSEQELLGMFEQGKISEQRRHEDAAARKTLAAHLTALHKVTIYSIDMVFMFNNPIDFFIRMYVVVVFQTENNYAERPDPARADLMSSFADWATVAEASILPFRYFLFCLNSLLLLKSSLLKNNVMMYSARI
jgi:hypothetical protein